MKRFAKVFLAFVLAVGLMAPTSAIAYDSVDQSGERFKSFEQNGVTFYDVYNGQTEARPEIENSEALIKQALYSKPDGRSYSPAEYWASFATLVFASNPASYRFNSEEGDHGSSKGADVFAEHFTVDPVDGTKNYGDVQKWLASQEGGSGGTDGSERLRDVNMKASGLMTARNLSEVEDMAFEYLADVAAAKVDANDFSKYNTLKGMNDKASTGDVFYHLMAVRDREGKTPYYEYDCFGIAYYDFKLTPFTGEEGEGLTTALAGYETVDEAVSAYTAGHTVRGFNYSDSSSKHAEGVRNSYADTSDHEVTTNWSQEEELSSEVSQLTGTTIAEEQAVNFTFGKDDGFFHAETGFSFTEEELFQEGMSSSNSTVKSDGGSSSQIVPIPGHTALELMTISGDTTSTASYDCPVLLTYKVAIFCYNGNYYDDNCLVQSFSTAGYEQRSFFAEFGSDVDGTGATQNLRERIERDEGYDASHGVTRGIRNYHGTGDDCSWDENPWVTHIDYGAMAQVDREDLRLSPGYEETTDFLAYNQPFSLTGGLLSRVAHASETVIGEAVPLYPLESVTLARAQRDKISLKPGGELHLRNIHLEAWDTTGIAFYGFIPENGYWYLCDEGGNPVDQSDAVRFYQNLNGDYVVEGVAPGVGYVKYGIPEGQYKYVNNENAEVTIDSSSVATPIVTLIVEDGSVGGDLSESVDSGVPAEESEAASEGAVVSAEEVNASAPQEAVDAVNAFLACDSEYTTLAEACLFAKAMVGQQSTLNEIVFAETMLQLAGDRGIADERKLYELEALVWAVQNGFVSNADGYPLCIGAAINELQMACLAYRVAVAYGKDVSCEDVVGSYAGAEELTEEQKNAMDWAIGKGLLSEDEQAAKSLDLTRPIRDEELAAYRS